MSIEVTGRETKMVNILQLLYVAILAFAKSITLSAREEVIWFNSSLALDLTTLFHSLRCLHRVLRARAPMMRALVMFAR